jgi:Ca2+-transporting ATPase
LMGVLYIERLRDLFRFSVLHPIDLVICLSVALVSVTWMEFLRSEAPDGSHRSRS